MTDKLEEPDTTPLINVNLVLLVMTLALASHTAKLLPLVVPRSEITAYVATKDAIVLKVEKEGKYSFGDQAELSSGQVTAEIARLAAGSIVMVAMDPTAEYEGLILVMDQVMLRPDVQVAFGASRTKVVPATTPEK